MAQSVEQTHRFAELALGSLKQLGLSTGPRNFDVWYAHAEGRNPSLSRDIQKRLGEDGTLTQSDLDALYNEHIAQAGLASEVLNIVARFEHEILQLGELIEASGESAHGHGLRLQELTHQLHQSTEEYPSISSLLENLLAVTMSVREENQLLERRLAESSDEITNLRSNVETIQQEAMTDPLTGVKNRKSFDIMIESLVEHAKQTREPLALVVADIDHFKKFNDRWGHQTGDHVLRLVAQVMSDNVASGDLLARYGGEEFAILLPGATLENAATLADQIRTLIQSRRLKKRRTNEDLGLITVSMGIAQYEPGDTSETLIERADERLYEAKRTGRNRVVCQTPKAEDEERAAC